MATPWPFFVSTPHLTSLSRECVLGTAKTSLYSAQQTVALEDIVRMRILMHYTFRISLLHVLNIAARAQKHKNDKFLVRVWGIVAGLSLFISKLNNIRTNKYILKHADLGERKTLIFFVINVISTITSKSH